MSEEKKDARIDTSKYGIYQKLALVQSVLKAPKNQRNKFGGYNDRSAEDILEAVKPLAIKVGALVTIHDDLILIGDRYYVKAVVEFHDIDHPEVPAIVTSALAREEEQKKGMDGSQVTGASSSYARKYALNGMFCIDDTKDSDATNDHGKGGGQPEVKKNPVGSAVAAAQQAAKPQVNPKYKSVWKAYIEHPANSGLDQQQLKDGFNNLRVSIIGKEKKAAEYTDEDWDKLASAIAELSDDLPY